MALMVAMGQTKVKVIEQPKPKVVNVIAGPADWLGDVFEENRSEAVPKHLTYWAKAVLAEQLFDTAQTAWVFLAKRELAKLVPGVDLNWLAINWVLLHPDAPKGIPPSQAVRYMVVKIGLLVAEADDFYPTGRLGKTVLETVPAPGSALYDYFKEIEMASGQ